MKIFSMLLDFEKTDQNEGKSSVGIGMDENQEVLQQKPRQTWWDEVETEEGALPRWLMEAQQVKQSKNQNIRCQEVKVVCDSSCWESESVFSNSFTQYMMHDYCVPANLLDARGRGSYGPYIIVKGRDNK